MIIHNFDPVFIDLGFLQIRWYSIAYILGILLGWIYIRKLISNTKKSHDKLIIEHQIFDDFIIYLVVGIIIGGRLGYIVFYNISYFSNNLLEMFMVWKGGMSFHGGLAGVVIASLFFGKVKKINFFKLTDVIACAAPIGIFFGRIANFINGELYGKISNAPWAVFFAEGGNVARHPSQIYEALLEGIILFVIINYLAIKKRLILKTGNISSLFLIFYSILRIAAEAFREPDQHLGYYFNSVSMGTMLSFFMFLVGLMIYYIKNNE